MNEHLRTTLNVRVSGENSSGPALEFIASDETLDRCGEVVSARGWELERYRKNPVFQNAHNYGDVIHTLGRAVVTEVRGDHLYQRVEFAVDVNPLARIAYGLYKGRFLNAVSVGFTPLEWEEGSARTPWRRRYVRQELLEVSAVGIPANPNALALGLKAGTVQREDLEQMAEYFRRGIGPLSTPGLKSAHTPAIALATAIQRLLAS